MASQQAIRDYIDSVLHFGRTEHDTYTDIVNCAGEEVVITYLPVAITGTGRPKPQIRLFLDQIQTGYELAKMEEKRHFILSYYDRDINHLSYLNHLNPSEWFISLEVNEEFINGGRVDIRSMFEYLDGVLQSNPNEEFVKCSSNNHASRRDLQASFLRVRDSNGASTPDNLSIYFKIYDNRPYLIERNRPTYEIDASRFPCTLRENVKQEIRFGAPGTGKSYSIASLIRESYPAYQETDDNPFVIRTTVYSEFSYYDFIGNILPVSNNGEITYQFSAGPFSNALSLAIKFSSQDVFLIVEEMSRGDIASIFGDIFQLLDRKENGESEYRIDNKLVADYLSKEISTFEPHQKIYLPSNLHIIGTVNTSDQNVNVIDTAFKRRFDFVYESVEPVSDDSGNLLNSFNFDLGEMHFEWNEFYQKVNEFIVNNLGLSEDKQLGQFFVKFYDIPVGTSADEQDRLKELNFNILKNKVLHYLWDDVQAVAVTDSKIFRGNSFSNLFSNFKENSSPSMIFSKTFLDFYTGGE